MYLTNTSIKDLINRAYKADRLVRKMLKSPFASLREPCEISQKFPGLNLGAHEVIRLRSFASSPPCKKPSLIINDGNDEYR